MSVAEIIEQIKQLPKEERLQISQALSRMETQDVPGSQAVDDHFKKMADEIFTTNSELFRKLAQ